MVGLASVVSFLLIAALTYLIYAVVRYVRSFLELRATLLRDWPGLPPHWLYGNVKQFPLSDPKVRESSGSDAGFAFWRDMNAKFPHGYRWFTGAVGLGVTSNHPDIMRAVMKGKDPKPLRPLQPNYRFVLPWLGKGLLLADGSTWLRNRRLITHAFHFDVLKTYMTIYNKDTDILLSKMSRCAASGESFEVTRNISLCTLDILLKCAFSYESNCQITGTVNGLDVISLQKWKDNHPYVTAVRDIALAFRERSFSPLLYPDFVFKRCDTGKKFYKNVDYLHKVSDEVIQKRRAKMDGQKTDPDPIDLEHQYLDFLGILLAARDEDGKGLTDLQIRNEVDTFLFEGHDTTASGLTWMLYVMAKYPEHQKKVQEEIDEVLGGRNSDEILWEDLGKFPYMVQCLKEAMRLYPPVPTIQREIVEKDIVVKEKRIPKGAIVYLNIFSLHNNPEVWPNPSEFMPDRFSPENARKIDPFAYVPFSAGPRNCIGQNFALNEEKVILARVLRKFHLELDPDHKVITSHEFVYKAKTDIKLKLKPRF